jgi:hypothetical protein
VHCEAKHGDKLETWWKDNFGYGFDYLTELKPATSSVRTALSSSEIVSLRQEKRVTLEKARAVKR